MTARTACIWMALVAISVAAPEAPAEVVAYSLENVILDDNDAQMSGAFTWTYDPGDFENGVGQFSFLDIPFTNHDHTDLDAMFDVGNSIEITYPGSVHDDGVDITLFLLQPLTPTAGSPIDLERSAYEIGGNGFHTGVFLSGSVVVSGATAVEDLVATAPVLTAYPNPFNPRTTVDFVMPTSGPVRLAVYDIRGRLTRTLVDEHRDEGEHAVTWDGRGDDGLRAVSGTYFVRLTAAGAGVVSKVVLVQ